MLRVFAHRKPKMISSRRRCASSSIDKTASVSMALYGRKRLFRLLRFVFTTCKSNHLQKNTKNNSKSSSIRTHVDRNVYFRPDHVVSRWVGAVPNNNNFVEVRQVFESSERTHQHRLSLIRQHNDCKPEMTSKNINIYV